MGFFDKLFGREEPPTYDAPARNRSTQSQSPDAQAVARYLYLLKTAPPEEIEQAHEEAFSKLSPEQRRQVLEQLGQVVPQSEYSGLRDDPQSLARAATRAEMQRPGALRQAFGGVGMNGGMNGGMGMGSMMMGGLFSTLAGAFIGTSIAHAFFDNPANESAYQQSPESGGEGADNNADSNSESNTENADTGSDANSADAGADSNFDSSVGEMDAGFGGGDFGGDFGGGDFEGGDFGGGGDF